MSTAGPRVDITLHSVFASKKKSSESGDKSGSEITIAPGNFQVSAKLDEESRKDSILTLSFVVSLNDSKGLVTYEFRGMCTIVGTTAEFTMMMEAERNRVPAILDVIYQRIYPVMFLMAGVTIAPYPQSTALASEMISTQLPVSSQPPSPSTKKEAPEPIAKIEEEKPARVRSKAPPPSDASSELETEGLPSNEGYKTKEQTEAVDKPADTESVPVTKKTQSNTKGKVALT